MGSEGGEQQRKRSRFDGPSPYDLAMLNWHDPSECQPIITASIGDYPPASHDDEAHNRRMLDETIGQMLRAEKHWDNDCGLVRLSKGVGGLEDRFPESDILAEFTSRWRAGSFSLDPDVASYKQALGGGWKAPYGNTLLKDTTAQQRSVLVVNGTKYLNMFMELCPALNKTVALLTQQVNEVCTMDLVPSELTFYFGYNKASCTLWHDDTTEHDKLKDRPLVLTTNTRLNGGGGRTSMCVADFKETYLDKAGDTVLFDAGMKHRSGETCAHIIKLSIHWQQKAGRARSANAAAGSSSGANKSSGGRKAPLARKSAKVEVKAEADSAAGDTAQQPLELDKEEEEEVMVVDEVKPFGKGGSLEGKDPLGAKGLELLPTAGGAPASNYGLDGSQLAAPSPQPASPPPPPAPLTNGEASDAATGEDEEKAPQQHQKSNADDDAIAFTDPPASAASPAGELEEAALSAGELALPASPATNENKTNAADGDKQE